MFYGLAIVSAIPALISIGQAVWHLIVQDELWGLAVAWKGGSGVALLWLSYWLWRCAERRRPSSGADREAD
jgi:hypothetical protein